ncbi:site-specific integrase [Vreelandella piezotolerans]|uniref:Site-specific integrase n=1 Tax=Vreelandella piezotolerans TaxID=2609667 RepID=A0ABQ6X8W0_9GAMM|nr:site-specific integrase [Halomonas piezotolerans]KAE8438441.1 site-specific integrase [Halomonas piezotolerans]QJA22874.1 site-specific integrase [Halomonas piezotolerans]
MPKKQTAAITLNQSESPVTTLKQTLKTARSGETYVYESNEWRIGRTLKLPWSALDMNGLTDRVSPMVLDSFRKTMSELVEEVSERYARDLFDRILSLLHYCTDEITIKSFELWRTNLSTRQISTPTRMNYLQQCRSALIAWSDGGYPGLERELGNHVHQIKTSSRNNTGQIVREQCPVRGPFSQIEEVSLLRWIHAAYADGTLSLQVYAIFLIQVEFGCRPVEIGAMRACDVIEDRTEHIYELAIPTAKGSRNYRAANRKLELPPDLYALLKQVIAEGQNKVAQAWGQTIPPQLSKKLPLFIGRSLLAAGSIEAFEHRLTKTPRTFDVHIHSHIISSIQKCPVTTDRLAGDILPISLYRFRRTVATRLAEAGASDELIASVLGHVTTDTVKVYTSHTYEDQAACDGIMVEAWEPVLDLKEKRLLGEPIVGQAKINLNRDDQVGNCAQLCGSGIFSCYACPKFHPFIDAPHNKALAQIVEERQKRISQGLSGQQVDSLDLPIAAIKATIRLCEEIKSRKKP